MGLLFQHFKDECGYIECKTFEESVRVIDDYMGYYNNYRCQWNLKKMTPI